MSLNLDVAEYVKACFTGIWIKTYEQDAAITELVEMCAERPAESPWALCHWDVQNGLNGDRRVVQFENVVPVTGGSLTPTKQFRDYGKKLSALFDDIPQLAAQSGARVLFVLRNFHRKDFVENVLFLQALQNLIAVGKQQANPFYMVIMSPVVSVPLELERHMVVVEHKLPTRDELQKIAESVVVDKQELPQDWQPVLESASGLTRYEAEGAFSLSLVRTLNKDTKLGEFDPAIIWGVKSQVIKKRGVLELYEGHDTFETTGGLGAFRDFAVKLAAPRRENPLLQPKGLLTLGVPGSGKSMSVKCLGNATNRRVLFMNMGKLRSKWQGESDANLEQALELAEAMAPSILAVEEVEKALSGVGSGGGTDGGTGERMFGRLLNWLNDKTADVLFFCTCNNIQRLMETNPEFVRAERFDAMFFFDVLGKSERRAVWDIYIKMYGLSIDRDERNDLVDKSKNWTGAEIKSCCRLSAILGESIQDVLTTIEPIAEAPDSNVQAVREWASGRCRAVNVPGKYVIRQKDVSSAFVSNPALKGKRKIVR